MHTYQIDVIRRAGSASPVRAAMFLIDADTPDEAESIADARLARMQSFPGAPELDIDSCYEVTA